MPYKPLRESTRFGTYKRTKITISTGKCKIVSRDGFASATIAACLSESENAAVLSSLLVQL